MRVVRKTPKVRAAKTARRMRIRREARGRVCKWCQITDGEVSFESLTECDACRRARNRQGCPKCGGPRFQKPFYCPCSPPAYMFPVIILDAESDRERTIYRPGSDPDKPHWAQWVCVGGNHYQVPKNGDPLVVTLPTKKWLRARR